MILIEYIDNITTSVLHKGEPVVLAIKKIALQHPESGIVIFKKGTGTAAFLEHIKELATPYSFISSTNTGLQDVGYVEDSPFIKVSTNKAYPTWIKSDTLVYIHARFVNQIGDQITHNNGYLYWLNSVGKRSRPQGIFNYQVPVAEDTIDFSDLLLYRFVMQHYKRRWLVFLLLCHVWYERRFPAFAFAKACFSKSQTLKLDVVALQKTDLPVTAEVVNYDVIIPTMGRAAYLREVLNDLAAQTALPQKVVIVEQNLDLAATTALDYVITTAWPFKIVHHFTHQTGACNARNLAIKETTAPWVMFFDDDLRLEQSFAWKAMQALQLTGAKALTFACLQAHEREFLQAFKQWESFGSGCSIVHRDAFLACSFDKALEHGYGEDVDYGMQLRNAGYDVIYAPQIQLVHLKAPTGGFRKPHIFPWSHDAVQPKPSPQIMYHRKKNYSTKQLRGYKMMLFIKTFGQLGTKSPWGHYRNFAASWKQSAVWAGTL
jgi:GT2 family glycosyltransferase